jgi:uncharacterized protein YndB with AHSA1/START domain
VSTPGSSTDSPVHAALGVTYGGADGPPDGQGLGRVDGDSSPRAWPSAAAMQAALPPLHLPAAMPLVRDRYERLVTAVEIPAAAEDVWHALTDPDALRLWLAVCKGSPMRQGEDCMLDFEDGEFFLLRPTAVEAPRQLAYVWRWLGIGQPSTVMWEIAPGKPFTRVTVTEEAVNPPWDWQTWNGGGWPGILDQLAAYLRTGSEWRWPWRRMGPYAQVELPVSVYEAWDRLTSVSGQRFWLQVMRGSLAQAQSAILLMGDASGSVEFAVREVVQPGESAPSFLPHLDFGLRRAVWGTEVGGRIWLEPAGWGRSLLQVVHYNWENLPAGLQLPERKILASFWAGAAHRALFLCSGRLESAGPHSWS